MFLLSFSLIVNELLLTRLFGVVLFAQFAHLALALALLGRRTRQLHGWLSATRAWRFSRKWWF